MFKGNDEQFLLRALAKNSVNLFLGAGFSRDAENQLGSSMPTGWGLAKGIWNFLGYDGAYDDTPLDRMYAAMLSSGKKDREIQGFLESRFLCEWLPEEYSLLTKVYWHRIYTTNIDNVIEHAYLSSGGESKLEILSYPMDEMKERDQTLSKTQLIHLNGRLPCKPNQVTFSLRQYARRALYADPLYEGFHSDYVARSTIFIGTELNEPLFWQCIEARGARLKNDAERRKKSFLIAPEISQPQREVLKEYNVVPVEATAADFLNWIESKSTELPTRIMILRDIMPDIATVIEEVDLDRSERRARLELSKSFHSVPQVLPETSRPSLYLLGATPKWEDILANRDAPREITGAVREKVSVALKSNDEVSVFVLLGSAGCGKSTVLRRLGHDLASSGIRTLLTNSEEIPSSVQVAKALESYNEKTILLFDNSEGVLGAIPSLIEKLSKIDYPPILIIASRTNDFQRRIGRFSEHVDLHKIDVPNLSMDEIKAVIQVLDENGFLGNLQGMNTHQRIHEFETRAGKQILVAMREATSGQGFDSIIADEFEGLVPRESKLLYLCTALSTEAGYRLTKDEFISCSSVTPAETLSILEKNLSNIVIQSGAANDLLMVRHRKIAEFMIESVAPREMLKEAYISLLSAVILSGDRFSRGEKLFRALINHSRLFKLFEENVEEARDIYNSIKGRFKASSQFWLQYGNLELTYGSLGYSENYIDQADSLNPDDPYIINAKAHLLLKKGTSASTKVEAIAYRDEGSSILDGSGMQYFSDAYAYHIFCSERKRWANKWCQDGDEKRKEFEYLLEVVMDGIKSYPLNTQLKRLHDEIKREYLHIAVN